MPPCRDAIYRVSVPPRRVSVPPRRVSVPPRRVSLPPRRVSLPPRRVSVPPRRIPGRGFWLRLLAAAAMVTALLAVPAAPALAATMVCGSLSTSTWSGTIEVCGGGSGGAYIPAGSTITVSSGTTVEFDSGGLLAVYGTLDANGITVQATSGTVGDWDRIEIDGGGVAHIINSTISDGLNTFLVKGGSLELANSTIKNLTGTAISANSASLTISNTTIAYCSSSCMPNNGVGIDAASSYVDLNYNNIQYADVAGIRLSGATGSSTVSDNTIVKNGTGADGSTGGSGMIVSSITGGTTALVENNAIDNNGLASNSSSAGLVLTSADGATLTCNRIENNSAGVLVTTGSGSIVHSDLLGNTTADAIATASGTSLSAHHDWWGQASGPTASQTQGTVSTTNPLAADIGYFSSCVPTPAVSTGSATAVTGSGATLSGSVNPNALDTHVHFDWGTTPTYGHSTASQDIGDGVAVSPVTASLTGLFPGTVYHYRIVASNAAGTVDGSDATFITCASPPGLSDGFTCGGILPKWTQVDPGGGATFTPQSPSGVQIQAPASTGTTIYDLSHGNAPRLMQNTRGDFTLRVHVDTTTAPNAAPTTGQAAGLLVWVDSYDYLYLARGPDGVDLVSDSGATPTTVATAAASGNLTLELIRTGNTYAASYQVDGNEWQPLASTHVTLNDLTPPDGAPAGAPQLSVGLFVASTSTSAPYSATFDNFDALSGLPGRWTLTGSLHNARFDQVLVTLHNGDVLALGGDTQQTELYDPQTGTWSASGAMIAERHNPTAVLLANGNVLVAGGTDAGGVPESTSEIYDASIGSFAATTGSMSAARANAGAVVLPSGGVLVAGGDGASGALTSAEIFTPNGADTDGTWTATGSMAIARDDFSLVLTGSGTVLAAGGGAGSTVTASAEAYSISGGTWSSAGSMSRARESSASTLLTVGPNAGKVLVAGGNDALGNASRAVDLYNPGANTWSSGPPMSTPQGQAAFATLRDGRLLVAGGYSTTQRVDTVEAYNPLSNAWTAEYPLHDARYGASAAVLADGRVLVTAGQGVSGYLASTEVWDPDIATPVGAAGSWQPLSGSSCDPAGDCIGTDAASVTITSGAYNGDILVAGGCCDAYGNSETVAGLYTPSSNTWTWSTMGAGREAFTLTYLPASGDVVAIGGFSEGTSGVTYLNTAEIYNPSTNTWTAAANTMSSSRAGHTAALVTTMPVGCTTSQQVVLVAGGVNYGGSQATSELFDPTNCGTTTDPTQGAWTPSGIMAEARALQTMTTLTTGPDAGKLVVIGGMVSTSAGFKAMFHVIRPVHPRTTGPVHGVSPAPRLSIEPDPSARYLASSEMYDPSSGAWTLLNNDMATPRAFHTATLLTSGLASGYPAGLGSLPDGLILVTGGYNAGLGYLNDCALFDPSSGGTWFSCGHLLTARAAQGAVLLPSGDVIVTGGQNDAQGYLGSTEVYHLATDTWQPGMLLPLRRAHAVVVGAGAGALVVGGGNDSGTTTEVESFNPSTATSAVTFHVGVPYYTPLGDGVGVAGLWDGADPASLPLTQVDATDFQGTAVVPSGSSTTYNYGLFDLTSGIVGENTAGGASCTPPARGVSPGGSSADVYDTVSAWCSPFTTPSTAAPVTFNVTLPSSTPAGASICLAGDILNGSNPSATHLTRSGTSASITVALPAGSNFNYHYTQCSAATPEADASGNPVNRSVAIVTGPQTQADTIAGWGIGLPSVSYPAPDVSSITTYSATVEATIDPAGATSVTYYVEYGLDSSYGFGSTTAAVASVSGPTTVSVPLAGLTAGQVYHWRLVASTSAGTTDGPDQALTTRTSLVTGYDLVTIPTSPLTPYTAQSLVSDIDGQNGGSSYVAKLEVWTGSSYLPYTPGFSTDFALGPGEGVFVQTGGAGTWLPAGPLQAAPYTIHLNAGYNLVGEAYPSSHNAADIVNQINTPGCTIAAGTCTITKLEYYSGGFFHSYAPGYGTPPSIATSQGFYLYAKTAVDWVQ